MQDVVICNQMMQFGGRMGVSFHRTLRIPEDMKSYPLPAGLGRFPIFKVSEFTDRLPSQWLAPNAGFIPMYQCEALWIGFNGAAWKPNAVVVAVGGINALSGEPFEAPLRDAPQNYLVAPPQPWLDGINCEGGRVRQFVAAPLGTGLTIESVVSGKESHGGIQISVYEPKPGRFPDTAADAGPTPLDEEDVPRPMRKPVQPMGIRAGGRIAQKIYSDPYGVDAWDLENVGHAMLHIVNSRHFEQITGQAPPPTPMNAKQYYEQGLPWFQLYDEELDGIGASKILSAIGDDTTPSEQGDPAAADDSIDLTNIQPKPIGRKKRARSPNSP
jgi:hypothetical protein